MAEKRNELTRVQLPAIIHLTRLGFKYFGKISEDSAGTIFDCVKADRQKRLDEAVDKIRKKYGNKIIQLAVVHKEPKLKELDIKGEHVIHPYSFFRHD